MSSGNALLDDLALRGLIAQQTGDGQLAQHLSSGSRTLYCGFDPTADSLHIGSLVPLLTLRRFQLAGHRPVALVGGATGLVGDPSFKAQERKLNTPDVVAGWVDRIRAQVSRFIDFDCGANSALVVNNLDWIGAMNMLDFLRDVGKHFSVNQMIAKESVKQRLDREGEGISFTEFAYMIMQGFDFAELYKRQNCTLQIGGSDQWGNITCGTELARRMYQGQVFGMTLPLVTKSDGTKFGKTESGTIWLDAAKTSPYAFYQFWLSAADADAYKFLRYFTFLSPASIDEIEAADRVSGQKPRAQSVLADQVTQLIHGEDGLSAAQRITQALFSGEEAGLSESDFNQLLQDGLGSSTIDRASCSGKSLIQMLVDAGMADSGKVIKDALSRQSVFINGVACSLDQNMALDELFASSRARYGRFFLVRIGKKKHHLFERII
jgi:tyrosyl-tRNA synthetase